MKIGVLLVIAVVFVGQLDAALGTEPTDSQQLRVLFDADQAIRSDENRNAGKTPTLQEERDRRFAVLRAVSEGNLHTANDFFHAGMILHHTSSIRRVDGTLESMGTESHLLAFFLFRQARDLGHKSAQALMGAAYNYYLRACGEDASKYGYKFNGQEIVWRPNVVGEDAEMLKCGFDPRPYVR